MKQLSINYWTRIIFLALSVVVFVPHTYATAPANKEKNVVFMFDLNDVFLRKTKKEALKRALFRPCDWPLRQIGSSIWGLSCKQFWAIIGTKRDKHTTTCLIQTAQDEGNIALVNLLNDMELHVETIDEMVDVARKLHEQGYTLYIGSNIAKQTLDALTKSDDQKLKAFFSYFDLSNPQVCDAHNKHPVDMPDEKERRILHPLAGKLIKKPHTKFFEQFLQRNKIDLSKTRVIFVDDKQANIDAAQKADLEGILFTGNVKEFESDMAKHGIIMS